MTEIKTNIVDCAVEETRAILDLLLEMTFKPFNDPF